MNLYGDVGGFGVSSDLTWQAYGGLGFQLNDWFSAQAGYRYLLEDFDDGSFVYDVALHGPLIGVSILTWTNWASRDDCSKEAHRYRRRGVHAPVPSL